MSHVFISYVTESWEAVDKIHKKLKSHGINVWLDRDDIKPGAHWKQAIREAIRQGAFFIACFSKEYNKRDKTYMNEELTVAIEELRQHPTDRVWFIPVKLNTCKIPDRNIGGGETLNDIQHVKLYKNWDNGIQRIIDVIQAESSDPTRNGKTVEGEINQNSTTESSGGFTDPEEVSVESNGIESAQKRRLTDWVFQQGNFLLKQEEIERAIEAYTYAIELDPRYSSAYHNRGAAYSEKDSYGRSIEDFTRAIELKPDDATAYNNRGLVYVSKREIELSIEDFTRAIELKPSDAEIYNNRGNAHAAKGEVESSTKLPIALAIKDYTKAIELKPDYAEAYYNRGIAYWKNNNHERAIKDYTKAIELKSDYANAFFQFYCFVKVFNSEISLALLEVSCPAIVIGFGKPWFQLYRLSIIFNSVGIVAFVAISITAIVIGFGIIGVLFYPRVIVFNGTVIIAFEVVSYPTILIGLGIIEIESYRIG